MKKVFFDNQIFKIQNFGGVSRYFAEVLRGLKNSSEFQAVPSSFYSTNLHLRMNGLTYLDRFTDDFHFPGKTRIENFLLKRQDQHLHKILKSGSYDLYHPTYYDPLLVNELPANKPFVLTVYDMIHELYFDTQFGRIHEETQHKRSLIPRATHIISISQNTKDDILNYFPQVPESRVTVSYLGSSFDANNSNTKIPLPPKYFLYVGSRAYYKNFTWFFNSISDILHSNDIMLVCAGGGSFTESEESLIRQNKLHDKVRQVAVSGDSDLAALYKNASCFIFPSLHEGFGIPVLEAFACGCPVVLPDASCFPEIAADAALYFKTNDARALNNQLSRILHEKELVKTLIAAGARRLKLFNWQQTIEQHQKIYNKVLAEA